MFLLAGCLFFLIYQAKEVGKQMCSPLVKSVSMDEHLKNGHFRKGVRSAAEVKGRIWEGSAGKLALLYLGEQH